MSFITNKTINHNFYCYKYLTGVYHTSLVMWSSLEDTKEHCAIA